MGFFGFGKTSSPTSSTFTDIFARYQRFRPIRLRLNSELVRRLPQDALNEGAKKLGMLRRGVLVFENEDETCVLMDYCVYDVQRKGRNAVEQYLCDCPPDPASDEMACLRAMQLAKYTLVVVLRVEPGVGCHVRNLFTDETRLLVDSGFSNTARPGTLMATRLLDFGDFVATSGPLPVGNLDDNALEQWQRTLRAGENDDCYDPAELIRGCLERGALSHVRYEEINTESRSDVGRDSLQAVTSNQRVPAVAKRHAGKPVANRRCRCGSGKMFKNCCGKKAKSVSEGA